jgi:DNA invertase Pin-like site-specific DNA recombinase
LQKPISNGIINSKLRGVFEMERKGLLMGYARVSTCSQNIDLQTRALEEAGVDSRFIFKDVMSGKSARRPELARILDFLKKGDTLVVWKLDRLARSLSDLIWIIENLEKKGVSFKSITENLDTTSHGGKLVFHIFGAISQFERDLIRERTTAGLDAAKERGVKLGRPKSLNKEQLGLLRELDERGKSGVEIAKLLGVSPATICREKAKIQSKLKNTF